LENTLLQNIGRQVQKIFPVLVGKMDFGWVINIHVGRPKTPEGAIMQARWSDVLKDAAGK